MVLLEARMRTRLSLGSLAVLCDDRLVGPPSQLRKGLRCQIRKRRDPAHLWLLSFVGLSCSRDFELACSSGNSGA